MNSGRVSNTNAPSRAQRFQFSIRGMLVLTTATAIVLSLRHYVPEFVDILFLDFILYVLLVLAIIGALRAFGRLRRLVSRLLLSLTNKLGLERFWLFRVLRRIDGLVQHLGLRRGLAANHRGNDYYREKDYDRAIVEFSKAIELEGRRAAMPYCNRGLAWYGKGEYDRALADFESSLRLNPRLPLAYSMRALVFITKREFDRAIDDCDASLRLDAQQTTAYFYRGIAMLRKELPDQALRDLDFVIARSDMGRSLSLSRPGMAEQRPP